MKLVSAVESVESTDGFAWRWIAMVCWYRLGRRNGSPDLPLAWSVDSELLPLVSSCLFRTSCDDDEDDDDDAGDDDGAAVC